MSRKENEQRALDIVAGRGDAPDAAVGKPAKGSLGTMELAGIALWLLVLVGGALVAVYHFVLAPQ